jgi:hypothetical protein
MTDQLADEPIYYWETSDGVGVQCFQALAITVDGVFGERGAGSTPRLMFEIVDDSTTMSSAHRCCADAPPIDENAWLTQGQIRDTGGRRYTHQGYPRAASHV